MQLEVEASELSPGFLLLDEAIPRSALTVTSMACLFISLWSVHLTLICMYGTYLYASIPKISSKHCVYFNAFTLGF